VVIVLDLVCDNEHRFEGWFGNADAFAEQHAHGLVACPQCGSTHVERRPSAPYVKASTARRDTAKRPTPPDAERLAAALRAAARGAEDVGEHFPVEARRIHYGDAEARSIRGRASPEDVGELLDEGILVLPVPEAPELQ
jgi:hypothetical protein